MNSSRNEILVSGTSLSHFTNLVVEYGDRNLRLPTTTYTKNDVLTSRPGGEESVHHPCPRHLDHSELLTPDISLHPDDHSCSKPENDLMESWTSKHGYVKIHFILVLKCVSSCQRYTVHSYSESKVLISFDSTVY